MQLLSGNTLKRITTSLLVFACLLVANAMTFAKAQTRTEDEHLLKAAYIYNFAKFTSWPENTWQEKASPLNICTMGKDPLISGLKRLSGKIIKERSVIITSIKNTQATNNCHLLYIAKSEKNRYQRILKSMSDKPVLTISELPNFSELGGMIELNNKNDQNHFIINLAATRNTGLEISARLLSLAVVINNELKQ